MSQQPYFIKISKIEAKDVAIPHINEMLFGKTIEENISVFDYTKYLLNINKIKNVKDAYIESYNQVQKMMSDCTINIKPMLDMYGVRNNQVIFTDGEAIYIHEVLSMIVASYYHTSLITEAFDYLKDIYTFGFAMSDSVLYQQCASNMPNEMLMAILKSRGMNIQ